MSITKVPSLELEHVLDSVNTPPQRLIMTMRAPLHTAPSACLKVLIRQHLCLFSATLTGLWEFICREGSVRGGRRRCLSLTPQTQQTGFWRQRKEWTFWTVVKLTVVFLFRYQWYIYITAGHSKQNKHWGPKYDPPSRKPPAFPLVWLHMMHKREIGRGTLPFKDLIRIYFFVSTWNCTIFMF